MDPYCTTLKQTDHLASAHSIIDQALSELKALDVRLCIDTPLSARDPVAVNKGNIVLVYNQTGPPLTESEPEVISPDVLRVPHPTEPPMNLVKTLLDVHLMEKEAEQVQTYPQLRDNAPEGAVYYNHLTETYEDARGNPVRKEKKPFDLENIVAHIKAGGESEYSPNNSGVAWATDPEAPTAEEIAHAPRMHCDVLDPECVSGAVTVTKDALKDIDPRLFKDPDPTTVSAVANQTGQGVTQSPQENENPETITIDGETIPSALAILIKGYIDQEIQARHPDKVSKPKTKTPETFQHQTTLNCRQEEKPIIDTSYPSKFHPIS